MKKGLLINGCVVILLLVFAISPLLLATGAGFAAQAYGCDLDEGSIHPCIANGRDIGSDLYTLFVLGWLSLATIPIGLGVLALYLVGVGVFFLIRRLRQA
jgi:hypothetical protein